MTIITTTSRRWRGEFEPYRRAFVSVGRLHRECRPIDVTSGKGAVDAEEAGS